MFESRQQSEKQAHFDAFMAAVRGVPAYTVAQVLRHSFTQGIDWRGSPKSQMAESYADAKAPRQGVAHFATYPQMARIDLITLVSAIRDWRA